MDKEVLKRLDNVDSAEWDRIVLQLTMYADFLLRRRSWRTGVPPKGATAEDIALESLEAIFDGTRKWNPFSNADLLMYLKSVVKSKVSHLYESKEYRVTDRYIEIGEGKIVEELHRKADPSADHAVHLVQDHSNNPEEVLLNEQEDNKDKMVVDSFLEAINGDEELEELALIIMDGHSKPREVALQIGKNVKYVYNLMKRFRRKCEEFKTNYTVK